MDVVDVDVTDAGAEAAADVDTDVDVDVDADPTVDAEVVSVTSVADGVRPVPPAVVTCPTPTGGLGLKFNCCFSASFIRRSLS